MILKENELDKTLINEISKKNEYAFERFVERYQKKTINLIYGYTHSMPDAEELAQDVFVKVWQKAGSFKSNSKVFTWVYRIAINLAINRFNKKRIPMRSLDAPLILDDGEVKQQVSAPQSQQPDFILEQKEIKTLITNFIEKLPPNQKMAFILLRYEARSYAEIAEIMEMSIPTVKSLLFRANQNLSKNLLPYKQKII